MPSRRAVVLLAAVAAAGCAHKAPPESPAAAAATAPPPAAAMPTAPAASAPSAAAQRTAAASVLAVERQWLAAWFKGTPVVVAQRANGAVVVEVPRQFCFEAGKEVVRPPLAAVLDKVARSMRRASVAELALIAAPGDPGGVAGLGTRRAMRVYDFLRARGVAAERLVKPSSSAGAAVQLRLEAPSPA